MSGGETAAFSCDGLAAICGAFLGTSTTTAYIESASGIEEGGRTCLVAVTVAVLFLLSTIFWPIAAAIPAAALIVVGALMLDGLKLTRHAERRRAQRAAVEAPP